MALDPLPWQTPPSGGKMSEEEYFKLDETFPDKKYEYLNGVARLMSGGSAEHEDIAFNIRAALKRQLPGSQCRVSGSDLRVRIGTKSNGRLDYVYSDVTVYCDKSHARRGKKLVNTPRIVVEVLSPSNEASDRRAKRRAYQACPTIQEIVLVDQFAPHVEIYRRAEDDEAKWDHVTYDEPEQEITLTSVNLSLPMAEIYEGINFDEPLLDEFFPDE
jgi:Uma2 family endonuclease